MALVLVPAAVVIAAAQMSHQAHHDMRSGHQGTFTDAPMAQEGSGTSWLPQSSPHFARMLTREPTDTQHLMGSVFAGYVDAGGRRGDSQWYSNSMVMWGSKMEKPAGTFGVHTMFSLDALTNGRRGVPNLFQTGETEGGKPLVDRQHPHDAVAEAALIFSKKVAPDVRGFVYAAPIGEPALGGPMFMHRPSGFEIPEAPITHHWFDSTHISFGVVTLGASVADKWKVEVSAFNGHEPDEDRFGFDPIALNSASARLTANPTPNWSLSVSYGYLNSPEELEPGVDLHRTTFSVLYNKATDSGNLALGLLYGRNAKSGEDTDAWNLEGAYSNSEWSVFGRWENVDKDELTGVPAGTYKISKFVIGVTKNVAVREGLEYGLGAYAGFYGFPSGLDPAYGRSPVTVGLFLRVRPTRM